MKSKKDWSKINRNLISRGSLQLWIPKNIAEIWYAKRPKKACGRPSLYSAISIQLSLVVGYWLNKPLRQTHGFMVDLLGSKPLELLIPDYTTVSRRASSIDSL